MKLNFDSVIGNPDFASPDEHLYVSCTPTVTTTMLPDATQGVAYSAQLTAAGGIGSDTWDIVSGTLPAGIALSATGLLSGTPSAMGGSTFTVRATDSFTRNTGTKALTLTVNHPAISGRTISFTGPSSALYGGASALTATGGTSGNPVVFSVDTSSGVGVCHDTGINGAILNFDAVGTCAIDANQLGDATHTAAQQVVQTVAVSPAPLTATVSSGTHTYGHDDPTPTISYSGLVNGDTAAVVHGKVRFSTTTKIDGVVIPSTPGSPPGRYAVGATGLRVANYAIAVVNGTLAVIKAPLTIAAMSTSTTYGALLPHLSVTYTGLVNGDTAASFSTPPTATTTVTAASPVGLYPISVSGAVDPDYAIHYTRAPLSVHKAVLTATISSGTRTVGQADPVPTISYSGLLNGDTDAVVLGAPRFTTTITINGIKYASSPSSPAGRYSIAVTGLTAVNYTIKIVKGTLTVTTGP